MKTNPDNLADQLRAAIAGSGKRQSEIAAATGISKGQLSGFMKSQRNLSQGSLDKLVECLGLRLVSTNQQGPTANG